MADDRRHFMSVPMRTGIVLLGSLLAGSAPAASVTASQD
jgi:hypothetical protein